jgi:hypothetical protein
VKRTKIELHARSAIVLLVSVFMAPFASADDEDDVRDVIAEYVATEATDLADQAKLMSDDRVYISGGVRTTDNISNMEGQVAGQKLARELDSDTKVIVTIEDLLVRVYGEAATASFYRYWTVIPGADTVRAGRTSSGPPDQVVTLVLAKSGGDWEIVHTHQSLMGSPQ